jgi:hypothetical protein
VLAMLNFTKSWGATTRVLAVQGSGFKRCCMKSGRYDGTRRNHYFQAKSLTT